MADKSEEEIQKLLDIKIDELKDLDLLDDDLDGDFDIPDEEVQQDDKTETSAPPAASEQQFLSTLKTIPSGEDGFNYHPRCGYHLHRRSCTEAIRPVQKRDQAKRILHTGHLSIQFQSRGGQPR